ncbi:hypothetical protein NPX13_g817 [Xylaria arbuscula]|uniref:Rhodopsin domain-containing protein n=1 Tax=Xylaria arbuscula TaxID=114810 RepID=A0A9W8NNR0_9PEZI|nr:hypothetical protein NPX13_g817 [Xylaria arbuscula]
MGSPYADLFPPGTDICQVPSGQPPAGQLSDFENQGLKPVIVSLSVIFTTIAVVFGLGRLFVNLRKLQWSDLFVFLVILLNIGYTVVLIVCIAYDFVIYVTSLILATYWATPHSGETWDSLINGAGSTAQYIIFVAIGQGAASILLDLYIFILPLPIIARLNLSARRKWKIGAIFLVGFLGVLSSVTSFVLRVLELTESESLYLGSVVLLTNLVEMDIALIVCSAPAFASFMRVYVLQSPAFMSIRSFLGSRNKDTVNEKEDIPNPNKPRTGREEEQHAGLNRLRGQVGMSDTWLFDSRATSDIETQRGRPESHERDGQ